MEWQTSETEVNLRQYKAYLSLGELIRSLIKAQAGNVIIPPCPLPNLKDDIILGPLKGLTPPNYIEI